MTVRCSYSGDMMLPYPNKLLYTLQYYYIDNCTIMRIDIGEELDITYTNSLLVATPIDGRWWIILWALGIAIVVFWASALLLLLLMNGCVVVIHLMIKELHKPLGKLLMLRSYHRICCKMDKTIAGNPTATNGLPLLDSLFCAQYHWLWSSCH